MPETLRLADGGYMRRPDVQNVIQYLYALQCVEITGFSNIGKSALLRLLAQPDVWVQEIGEAGQEFLPVYIDCNRMLDMSDQGFYELVLRCLRESSQTLADSPELTIAYETLVAPASDFQIPLSFNQGLTAALQATPQKLILLFDEFDEPFSQIDARVFLNLRALQDRYDERLLYVTATVKPLIRLREEDHCGEFSELFRHRAWRLAPLTRSDSERLIRRYMTAFEANFNAADVDFIIAWAGGHPNMTEGVCRALDEAIARSGQGLSDPMERWQLHRQVTRTLRTDPGLILECTKIWRSLSHEERAEMTGLFRTDHEPDMEVVEGLVRRHILFRIEGKEQPFCRLMTEYVQVQALRSRRTLGGGLRVDVESGEVFVDGKAVETLTNLEYRLMLLLFQNAEKIVDKYTIVSNVWGDSYIDEVDDARIEKLVSRLRQKIETDSSAPRRLTTVRGRGYKLLLK